MVSGRQSGGVFAVALACMLLSGGLPPVASLEDGRIGVLYIGCIARSRPFWDMRVDPLFSINFVQATTRDWAAWGPTQQASEEPEVERLVRLYMPRTYGDLSSRFDVIILSNANRFAVGPKNIEMLARGVEEANMGLLMAGGWESFGSAFGRPEWGGSAIGEILPTEDVVATWVEYPTDGLFLAIDEWDHEFISSIPWKRERAYFMSDFHHNLVKAKPGSEVLARVESMGFKDHPAMVTWDYGGARVFAYTGEIYFFYRRDPWTYYIDFGSNMMIYLDGRPVPQDIDLVHELRMAMFDLGTRKSLLVALLEFCDAFGANIEGVGSRVDELNALLDGARGDYLELRFQETLDTYREAGAMMEEIELEAIKLKDRALMWIYVIEWLAVTGTGMACGFFLWTVMIRRRIYREVRTTRLRDTGPIG